MRRIILIVICQTFMLLTLKGQVTQEIKVGELFPDVELVSIEGDTLRNSDLKGKITYINIFATWCQPCLMELPLIKEKIWEKYHKNKDFQLVIIGRNHTQKEVQIFEDKSNYGMPFYYDDNKASNKLAVKSIPRNYIIDKDGYVSYASKGFSNEEFTTLITSLKKMMK